jgi:hypothetical protein
MSEAQHKLLKRLCETHNLRFDPGWDRTEAKIKITQLIHREKKSGPPNMAA